MKKIFTYVMLLSFPIATFTSCGIGGKSTKGAIGGTVVKTVATVVGVILLSKLLKSVLKTVTGSFAFNGLSKDPQFTDSFNENTKLSSIAGNDLTKTALQMLIAEKYKIPLQTVVSKYSGLKTAGDLATFVGENADAKVLEGIK